MCSDVGILNISFNSLTTDFRLAGLGDFIERGLIDLQLCGGGGGGKGGR